MRTGFIRRILGRHEKVEKQVLLDCLRQLSEERDLLFLIFDNMSQGVLVLDQHEVLRFANRRAGDLLGFDPASCIGKSLESFLQNEEIVAFFQRSLQSGNAVQGHEIPVVRRDEPMALRFEATPTTDKRGRFNGLLIFVSDVTEQKRSEAERRETKRLSALASLSASLAHEIRNPLNSMGIHAQLLIRKLRDKGNEDLLGSVEVIREEIQNLNEKLTGFLDAARPRQPQFEEVSVHELLEETLQLMRPELEASGIEPEYYPPTVHTTVFADRVDLRKAFVNIIKNSLEAMEGGGRLVIRIKVEEPIVSITFEDNGVGIPEEVRQRIFELGFSTKDVGSGLGLAQVERCIREHHGEIEVESKEGGGTVVRITLPVLTRGRRLLEMAPPPPALAHQERAEPESVLSEDKVS